MDQKQNQHHFYTFTELLGHLVVLAALVVTITGGLRLVEVVLPTDRPASALTVSHANVPIASVSAYLQEGYLRVTPAAPATIPSQPL